MARCDTSRDRTTCRSRQAGGCPAVVVAMEVHYADRNNHPAKRVDRSASRTPRTKLCSCKMTGATSGFGPAKPSNASKLVRMAINAVLSSPARCAGRRSCASRRNAVCTAWRRRASRWGTSSKPGSRVATPRKRLSTNRSQCQKPTKAAAIPSRHASAVSLRNTAPRCSAILPRHARSS